MKTNKIAFRQLMPPLGCVSTPPLFFMGVSSGKASWVSNSLWGQPQCGHAIALFEISRLHSGHWIKAMGQIFLQSNMRSHHRTTRAAATRNELIHKKEIRIYLNPGIIRYEAFEHMGYTSVTALCNVRVIWNNMFYL